MVSAAWILALLATCSALNTEAYHCVIDSTKFTTKESLKKISGCRSVKGRIEIANYVDSSISFDNLELIDGSLSIYNSTELRAIHAPRLHTITNSLELDHLAALTTVTLPSLRRVYSLSWVVAPLLHEVVWNNLRGVEDITLIDTSIEQLVGISASRIQAFKVNNNRYLEYVAFNFDEVTNSFELTDNSRRLEASFSNLNIANNITVSDVTNLNMENLSVVSGTMNLLRNKFAYVAFPSLTSIGESLQISGNTRLEKADFKEVSHVGGGLVISNNTALRTIDFFPNLNTIDGALEIYGNFKETKWDSLRLVKGSIKLYSEAPMFDCSSSESERLRDTLIGGEFHCQHINRAGHLEKLSGYHMSGTMRHGMACGLVLALCLMVSVLI